MGQVAWIHPVAPPAERLWTQDPRLIAVRATTGDRLEVFAEEMADGNRIRRL